MVIAIVEYPSASKNRAWVYARVQYSKWGGNMRIVRSLVITLVVALLFSTVVAACSSDSEGDGGRAADADAEGALMLDTPEYKLAQEFPMTMEVSSTVFTRIRRLPIEYTCTANYWYPPAGQDTRYGEDKSPPLAWTGTPEGATSLAIIADDPDSVTLEKGVISPRVHWVIWGIPANVTQLGEGVPTTTEVLAIGPNTRQGANDYKGIGYGGPCPPPNVTDIARYYGNFSEAYVQKPHGYMFTVYALDTQLDLAAGATKNQLLRAMDGHILAGGNVTGEYINKKLFK